MKTLLTRPRPTDTLPGLTGIVRDVTTTDPAITELFQAARAAGRAVEEAKAELSTREQAAQARRGDMLDQLAAVRELRITRAKMVELQGAARAAHQAWSEAVVAAVRATYRDLIHQRAKILEQVSALEIEHDALIAALNDSNVSGFAATLRPMSLCRGELRHDAPYTAASLWLAEAKSFGLLD